MASGKMLAGAVFCMVLVLGGSAAAQAKLLSNAASSSQVDGLPVHRRLLMNSWTSTAASGAGGGGQGAVAAAAAAEGTASRHDAHKGRCITDSSSAKRIPQAYCNSAQPDPSVTPGRPLQHSAISVSTPSAAATTQQQQQVRCRSLLQDGDADGSADDEDGQRPAFSHNNHKHDTISRRLEKVGWPLGMHVHHTDPHATRL